MKVSNILAHGSRQCWAACPVFCSLQISFALDQEEMREVAFHLEATLQTLLRETAMTFIYPALSSYASWECKWSAGLGTVCSFKMLLHLFCTCWKSTLIIFHFKYLPIYVWRLQHGSLFITKGTDQSAGRGLILNITRVPGESGSTWENQVIMLVPPRLCLKGKCPLWWWNGLLPFFLFHLVWLSHVLWNSCSC